jgi:hypothetical protein
MGVAVIDPILAYQLPQIVNFLQISKLGHRKNVLLALHNANAPTVSHYMVESLEFLKFAPKDESSYQMILHAASRWQAKAIRALSNDDASTAVVNCSIWIEIAVVQVVKEVFRKTSIYFRERRKSESKIRWHLEVFAEKFLGMSWQDWIKESNNSHKPDWFVECAGLRNKITHEGHFCTINEAVTAYEASNQFMWVLTQAFSSNTVPSDLKNICSGQLKFRKFAPHNATE